MRKAFKGSQGVFQLLPLFTISSWNSSPQNHVKASCHAQDKTDFYLTHISEQKKGGGKEVQAESTGQLAKKEIEIEALKEKNK